MWPDSPLNTEHCGDAATFDRSLIFPTRIEEPKEKEHSPQEARTQPDPRTEPPSAKNLQHPAGFQAPQKMPRKVPGTEPPSKAREPKTEEPRQKGSQEQEKIQNSFYSKAETKLLSRGIDTPNGVRRILGTQEG